MNKTIIFGILFLLVIIYGCTSLIDASFKKGVKRINEIDDNFDAGMKTIPDSVEQIDGLLVQLLGFRVANYDTTQSF